MVVKTCGKPMQFRGNPDCNPAATGSRHRNSNAILYTMNAIIHARIIV